jgi:phosphate transport system substrate-binding protein
MKFSSFAVAAGLAVSLATINSATAQTVVQADGSSTVFPVTEAMAEEFQKANPGTKVTVGLSGTGGGFKKFCRGDTDISNASRPITASEQTDCKAAGIEYIELPIALDALTVIVNPRNTWAVDMTVAELKKIWEPAAQGKINNWKQVRDSFPDKPLTLYGPGTDSGTFDYFTAAINGKEKASRGDYTASEDDNVLVQGVAGDENALGYFGLAYYEENKGKLKDVKIKLDQNAPAIEPTLENARLGKYQPLSRPIFIYINKKSAAQKPEVAKFVDFYLTEKNAVELVKEVGYVPMPVNAIKTVQQRWKDRKVGTGFKGSEVGLSIENVLKADLHY